MTSSNPSLPSVSASRIERRLDNTISTDQRFGSFVVQPAGRVPSYKLPSSRFHPYRRPQELPPPRYEDNTFYNTIYDDECPYFLEVPERAPRTAEEEEVDRNKLQRLVDRIQRIRRLAAVMPEFFDGLRRAIRDN